MIVREARPTDAAAWERLRCELWADGVEDHAKEIAAFLAGKIDEPSFVLVVEDESGSLIAVAELSIRYDESGLAGTKTGCVEGLYVKPEWRHQGIARKLLQLSKDWAQKNKCEAFSSDRLDRVMIIERFQSLTASQGAPKETTF